VSPVPVKYSGEALDFSPRVRRTAAVVASPAAATETIVASLSIPDDLSVGLGFLLLGYAAYTVGTAGVTGNLRIRRTNVTGTIVKASGALTVAATELHAPAIFALDTGGSLPNQVYVLTLTIGSASAESAVSAVELIAVVV
jgi:hypothetical protein